ncbi:Intermediate filament protein [Rhizophlyctis rosea]|nr:Intermediate filament protein [Rhizophlyctis rosea]
MALVVLKTVVLWAWHLLYSIGFYLFVVIALLFIYAWYSAVKATPGEKKKLYATGHAAHATIVAERLAALPHTDDDAWSAYLQSRAEEAVPYLPPIFIRSERIQRLSDDLLEKVSRDFVRSWYPIISPEPVFLSRVDALLFTVAINLKRRAEHVDVVQLYVSKVLPLWTAHVTECHRAERLLRGERVRRTTADQDKADCQMAKYYLNGALHPAITAQPRPTLPLEQTYLRTVMDRVIPMICSTPDVNSKVFSTILREILVCRILQPMAESFSDPDFWNRTIAMLTESIIQREENLMTKIRDALERQNALDQMESGLREAIPRLRSYDEFLKLIKTCESLIDAGKIRDALSIEIQRKKTEIANCQAGDIINGVRVSDTRVYISRLLLAHRRIDKRISFLNGRFKAPVPGSVDQAPSLGAILDTPELLGAFMEYMDQTNRIHVLHFWMSVNSLRSILSPDALDDIEFDVDFEKIVNTPADLELLNDSALRICRDYLFPDSSHKVDISDALRQQLDECAGRAWGEGEVASSQILGAIFAAQHEIFREMEETDYASFLESSYYAEAEVGSPAGMLGSYHLEDNIENVVGRTGEESGRSRSPSDLVSQLSGEYVEDVKGTRNRKSMLLKVFRKKKRDEQGGLSTEEQKSQEDILDIEGPVRRDTSENVEGELEAILRSEENAFGSPNFGRKLRETKKRLSLRVRRSRSADMTSMRVTTEIKVPPTVDDSNSESESPTSPSKTSLEKTSLEKVSSKAELDTVRRRSFEKGGVGGGMRRPSITKSMSSAGLMTIGMKERVSVTTQLTLSALDASKTFNGASAEMERSPAGLHHGASIPMGGGVPAESLLGPSPNKNDLQPRLKPPRLLRKGSMSQPVLPEKGGMDGDKLSLHSSSSFSFSSQEDLSGMESLENREPEPPSPPSEAEGAPMVVMPKRVGDLEREIERLRGEGAVVQGEMQRLKEGGGDVEQIRKLGLMRTGLRVELEAAEEEKLKLEMAELQGLIMPGKTTVAIVSGEIVQGGTKDYAIYHLEVHVVNSEGAASEWTVARRFSEFFALHQLLRVKFPVMGHVEFPSKIFTGMFKLKKDIVDDRQVALEKYIQALLTFEDVCRSTEFRKFICHSDVLSLLSVEAQRLAHPGQRSKNLAPNADESLETFMGRTRGSTNLSVTPQTRSAAQSSLGAPSMLSSSSSTLSSGASTMMKAAEMQAVAGIDIHKTGIPASGSGLATDAIVELFIELFELREKNNWLRRRAVALVLQQLFGDTIEKRISENLRWAVGEENIAYGLDWVLKAYWPDGQWATEWTTRSAEDIRRTKAEAQEKLTELLPDVLGNMVGKQNAKRGAVRLWSVFQNRRLNQQLVYCLMDQVFLALFPELEGGGVVYNVKYSSGVM